MILYTSSKAAIIIWWLSDLQGLKLWTRWDLPVQCTCVFCCVTRSLVKWHPFNLNVREMTTNDVCDYECSSCKLDRYVRIVPVDLYRDQEKSPYVSFPFLSLYRGELGRFCVICQTAITKSSSSSLMRLRRLLCVRGSHCWQPLTVYCDSVWLVLMQLLWRNRNHCVK